MDKFFGLDNPSKMDKDTALLTTTHDDVEKHIICGILEEEEIPFLAKEIPARKQRAMLDGRKCIDSAAQIGLKQSGGSMEFPIFSQK